MMDLKKTISVALTVAGLVLSPVSATALSFNYNPTTHYLNLSGPVNAGDGDTFWDMIEKFDVKRVTLGPSLGGDSEAGLVISQDIFMKHIPTEDVDVCASACAIIFAGGRDSTMYVDNDTKYYVLAHCAENVNSIESGSYVLTKDDIQYTTNLLYGAGFSVEFTNDFVKLCDIKNNQNTFNFEDFLITHGFDIQYIDPTPVKSETSHGNNNRVTLQ